MKASAVYAGVKLDELTSNIDPCEEARIYEKFAQITKGRTAVLITHRIGSAKIADKIAVMMELAGDYQVHLVPMRGIPEEALQEMNSDLKYVLGIMKRTRSKKRYEAYILENQDFFTRIPKSAVDVIDACTNIKDIRASLDFILNQETGEKEADMCKALTDLKKDAERRGIERTNKLIELLLSDGRQDDLLRSARDTLF